MFSERAIVAEGVARLASPGFRLTALVVESNVLLQRVEGSMFSTRIAP